VLKCSRKSSWIMVESRQGPAFVSLAAACIALLVVIVEIVVVVVVLVVVAVAVAVVVEVVVVVAGVVEIVLAVVGCIAGGMFSWPLPGKRVGINTTCIWHTVFIEVSRGVAEQWETFFDKNDM
jgi:hypothetical protein